MTLFVAAVIVPPLLSWVAFLVLGALYTLPHRFRRLGGAKLQKKHTDERTTIKRGLLFVTLNSLASLALSFTLWPVYSVRLHDGALPPVWVIALQLLAFVLIDDLLFYFAHRALHTRWLYRHIHSWHHRYHAPYALLGAVMHPVEYLIISSIVVVTPLLLGMHVGVFWLCVIVRQWGNAEFHAGVEGPWSLLSRLPGAGGVRHHDRHHEKVRGNYSSLFSHLDRWLGTELEEETSTGRREDRRPAELIVGNRRSGR